MGLVFDLRGTKKKEVHKIDLAMQPPRPASFAFAEDAKAPFSQKDQSAQLPDSSFAGRGLTKQVMHVRWEFTLYGGGKMYPPKLLSCWMEGQTYEHKKKDKPKIEAKEVSVAAEESY